jgi:hypothetical protein
MHIDRLNRIPKSVSTGVLINGVPASVTSAGNVTAWQQYAGQKTNDRVMVQTHSGGIVGGRSFEGVKDNEVPSLLEKGEAVLTKGQQAALASSGGTMSGGATYNFTINNATDPDATVRAIRQFVKRNGPIQGIT